MVFSYSSDNEVAVWAYWKDSLRPALQPVNTFATTVILPGVCSVIDSGVLSVFCTFGKHTGKVRVWSSSDRTSPTHISSASLLAGQAALQA